MSISMSLTQEVCEMEAELCSAFSDPTRILILYELGNNTLTVTELTTSLNLPQPTISRHLKTLRDHGLVLAGRQGTNVFYSLADLRLLDALDTLRAIMRDRVLRHASLIAEMEM